MRATHDPSNRREMNTGYTGSVIKRHKKKKAGKAVLSLLMAVVLLCTTYTMIRPAAAMERQPFCGMQEHTHTENCYEQNLICGVSETAQHIHDESCYTESLSCVCGLEEGVDEHVHTEECFQTSSELTCTQPEEISVHEHTADCYENVLVCGLAEHAHLVMCYSNPSADLENKEIWDRSVVNVELTGVWADDLTAIAQSQIGYEESVNNFVADDEESIRGYSRYGAWYGDTYGHWCAMFVSFCLSYAGIPQEYMPYEEGCARWVEKLSELEMYESAEGNIPEKGDLIFFSSDRENIVSNHVGIVSEIITNSEGTPIQIRSIEGNTSQNRVEELVRDINDPYIVGFGKLLVNPETKELSDYDIPSLSTDELQALLEKITPEEFMEYLEGLSDEEYDDFMDRLSDDAQEMIADFLKDAGLSSDVQVLAEPPIDSSIYYVIRDENGQKVMHLSSSPFEDGAEFLNRKTYGNNVPYNNKIAVNKIVFDDRVTAPVNSASLLSGFSNAVEIENLNYLDTSNVVNMSGMFSSLSKLESIDLSGFDTSNATDMSRMFMGCKLVKSITGIESINAENVTSMQNMFTNCESLQTLDLSNIKTGKLESTSYMFFWCKSMTEIKLGGDFSTETVKDMSGMFSYCSALKSFDALSLNTSSATNMSALFNECRSLGLIDVTGFDTAAVNNMYKMFCNCFSLTELDLHNFNTEAVTDMGGMFSNCSRISELDLTSFETGNVTAMNEMFFNCDKLSKVDVSTFDTSNVTNMYRMFGAWNSYPVMQTLDLSNFDTSKVTNMNQMFINAINLQVLDISGFTIAEGTETDGFFSGISGFIELKAPLSVPEDVIIPLPTVMVNAEDNTQVFGRLPRLPEVTESLTLVPYDTNLLTESSESTLIFKKYLDGVLVNDPQRFDFGVFTEDGTDTGIRVKNDATGNIILETKELPLGRYYIQEITGSERVIYDTMRYYFTIEEESVSTQTVYPSTEVVYLPISEDYLDTSKYDLVANATTVTAYKKGTSIPVKTMRAYCADKSKGLTYGSVGTGTSRVYINPTENHINTARGVVYNGPNKGELANAIKSVLFFGDKFLMQEDIWKLLNFGFEVDTSRVGEIPAGFKWAIIQKPTANVQPLIVPLWTVENRDVYDSVEGDTITRRTVKLETTDISFRNITTPNNTAEVRLSALKTIDGGQTAIGENRFKFRLTGEGQDMTVENDAEGNIKFPQIVYTEPGTYIYTIEEITDDRDGVIYDFDKTAKTVTVTVSDDFDVRIETAADADSLVFNNTTVVSNSLKIGKTVTGTAGDKNASFKFTVSLWNQYFSQLNGTFDVVPGSVNGVEAPDITQITFKYGYAEIYLKHGQNITITGLPDNFRYNVNEEAWNQNGYTSSLTKAPETNYRDTDGANGAVDVEFRNHKDSFTANIKAKKTLDGGLPSNGQFTFILKGTDGNEIARKTNDASGEVSFEMTYTAPGSYTYTIEELDDGQEGIVYDTTVKTVSVNVGGGEQNLKVLTEGTTFEGSHTSSDLYITVDGTTQMDVYCIDQTAGYPGGSYNLVLDPDTAQLAGEVTANRYGDALAENMRKLLYYFDTHDTSARVRQSTLTKAMRQELVWCLTGSDAHQDSSYTDLLNEILAESDPPENYTVALFASASTPKAQPVIAGYLQSTVTFEGTDETFRNTHAPYELPETGGMGTTLFYIIGAVLVIGAGVVLVSRRRMGA